MRKISGVLILTWLSFTVGCDSFPVHYDVRAMGSPTALNTLDKDLLISKQENLVLAIRGPSTLKSNFGWVSRKGGTFPTFKIQITNHQNISVGIRRESFLLRYGKNEILGSMEENKIPVSILPGETKMIGVAFKDEYFPTLNEHPNKILPLGFELQTTIFENSPQEKVVFKSQWEVWRFE
jgi:hypothetical protein